MSNEPQILRRSDDPHNMPDPKHITRKQSSPKFPPGQIVYTPTVAADIEAGALPGWMQYLRRHLNGDWGDCSPADARENDLSVNRHLRIFSVYKLPEGANTYEDKLWIITEADRSATTLLYPSEY